MKRRFSKQSEAGEALTLDAIFNSIDAELIATGPSAKGPNRGAIVRHGKYTLWGFEGPVSDMTEAGRALFVNTIYYAAAQGSSPLLEKRLNGTRDGLFDGLEFAKRVPGYLLTMTSNYLPLELWNASHSDIERWLSENRPYLYVVDRRFTVDNLAKSLGIPNYRRAFLEKCLKNLADKRNAAESLQALQRYTGLKYANLRQWKHWYNENKNYLYFSDCQGFRFIIDEQAKAKRVPSAVLRKWSSENLDHRYHPSKRTNQTPNPKSLP